MLIATAGHIDHGKTALVRALTGIETDRLPEERARGISIELGFAYWRPDGGPTVGFVDVPGHERLVRTMIAGLSGIDCALLVVAADDGIMPQTIEHLRILDLLGLSRGFVALTKADRAQPELLAQRRAELASLLAHTSLAGAPVYPVSALAGTGVPELVNAILAARNPRADDRQQGFRLAIDRAFTVAGAGTVVTGTVLAGRAQPGDTLMLSPAGRELRLRGLQSAGREVGSIGPGERGAFNLAGLDLADVRRGDWLLAPAGHAPTTRIDALVRPLRDLPHGTRVHLHHGTNRVGARLHVPGQRALRAETETAVSLALEPPISAITGERFVLRDASGRELLGGGAVLDPLPPQGRSGAAAREARLVALARPDPADRLAMLAAVPGFEPELGWFARTANLPASTAEQMAAAAGLLPFKGRCISADRFAALRKDLLRLVAQRHAAHPDQAGLSRRIARAQLCEAVSADLFATLLASLSADGAVEADGALLRLPGHAPSYSAAESRLWSEVLGRYEDGPPSPLALSSLARELSLGEAAVSAMLGRRVAAGELWQVTPTRFMLRGHVAALASLAATLAGRDGSFTAAAFRDASGIGRNFTIDLLEFLDRIGVTRRTGETRVMRADWEAVTGD